MIARLACWILGHRYAETNPTPAERATIYYECRRCRGFFFRREPG